jgi:thioredoxin-like negative regulator of GroEL
MSTLTVELNDVNFGSQSIPTLIVFHDGRPVREFVGVQSEATLLSAIEQAGTEDNGRHG